MTKIKIDDFFGKNTSHLVGFCKKIGIIWVFGTKNGPDEVLGVVVFLAGCTPYLCLLIASKRFNSEKSGWSHLKDLSKSF